MNRHQIRAIRNTLKREQYNYYKERYDLPFTRKKVSGLRFNNKKPYYLGLQYILTKPNNTYCLYNISVTKDSSRSLYIITKNDIIIYWNDSNIFAPAIAAWHLITEVYHGYKPHNSSYQWQSVDEFDCIDVFLSNGIVEDKRFLDNIIDGFSSYQLIMYDKTGKYYIDRKFIDQQTADELASKEYHHV